MQREPGRRPLSGSAPDAIWNGVKIWAQARAAQDGTPPTHPECLEEVERVVRLLLGPNYSFPRRVIDFYAEEALTMIERLKSSR